MERERKNRQHKRITWPAAIRKQRLKRKKDLAISSCEAKRKCCVLRYMEMFQVKMSDEGENREKIYNLYDMKNEVVIFLCLCFPHFVSMHQTANYAAVEKKAKTPRIARNRAAHVEASEHKKLREDVFVCICYTHNLNHQAFPFSLSNIKHFALFLLHSSSHCETTFFHFHDCANPSMRFWSENFLPKPYKYLCLGCNVMLLTCTFGSRLIRSTEWSRQNWLIIY